MVFVDRQAFIGLLVFDERPHSKVYIQFCRHFSAVKRKLELKLLRISVRFKVKVKVKFKTRDQISVRVEVSARIRAMVMVRAMVDTMV